jgi:uncharacterized protein
MIAPAYARTLAGVPVLIAEPASRAAGAPVVIWHHGFQADALAHAGELERCAQAGFLAVGVDAIGHGARRDPAMATRIERAEGGALEVMLECVQHTIAELPALLDALDAAYRIDRSCVSMVGISMGAFLTYRAVAGGLQLRAAVALLGAPDWPPHAPRALRSFQRVALLSVTAEHDTNVSPVAATALHAALTEQAPPASFFPQHHFVLRGAGHLTTGEAWQRAMRVTMQWLERWGTVSGD